MRPDILHEHSFVFSSCVELKTFTKDFLSEFTISQASLKSSEREIVPALMMHKKPLT